MQTVITPTKLRGSVEAISSKSFIQRALIAAFLCDEPTILNVKGGTSADVEHAKQVLVSLGCTIKGTEKQIHIFPPKEKKEEVSINCGSSATLARMFMPILSTCFDISTITGTMQLATRPLGAMSNVLSQHGVEVSGNWIPLTMLGKLESGTFEITGDESSQYISGLMYALPLLKGNSSIKLTTPLQSSGYAELTRDVLKRFSIEVSDNICGNQKYVSPGIIDCEGDWSNAAFWHAVDVEVLGLDEQSFQPDKAFRTIKDQEVIDVSQTPDLLPILGVYAAAQEGKTTRLINAERLRIKESDRLDSVAEMLISLGAGVENNQDNLVVHGVKEFSGAEIYSYDDHRIVMAAAIASCWAKDTIVIQNSEAVEKSYPSFIDDFCQLGGHALEFLYRI